MEMYDIPGEMVTIKRVDFDAIHNRIKQAAQTLEQLKISEQALAKSEDHAQTLVTANEAHRSKVDELEARITELCRALKAAESGQIVSAPMPGDSHPNR